MLGLMFVPASKRAITIEEGRAIAAGARGSRFQNEPPGPQVEDHDLPWFAAHAKRLRNASKPLIVGVFQDAPLNTILDTIDAVQLDCVQLHGKEPLEWAQHIPVPVIRAFHVAAGGAGLANATRPNAHSVVLVDSLRSDGLSGGSGVVADLDAVRAFVDAGEPSATGPNEMPIILAGGLTPQNVAEAIQKVSPWAVDVSGGVENEARDGKDLDRVAAFIDAVKGLVSSEPEPQTSEEGESSSS